MLSTGKIIIQQISVSKTNRAIHWIGIYFEDNVIQLSNNWDSFNKLIANRNDERV